MISEIASAPPVATLQPSFRSFRRRADRILRWNMFWAALASLAVNFAAFFTITHIPGIDIWFDEIFFNAPMDDDELFILTFIALITIVFLVLVYTRKVKNLLTDVQRLAVERDREREAASRRQKLESLGYLAAGLSHEINTSLQTVLGSCEMAQYRMSDTEQLKHFLQRAVDNSLHARRVISKVLAFSASRETDLQPYACKDILQEAVDYSTTFLPADVKVLFFAKDENATAAFDRVGFIQAFSNIMTNAAQAMQHKGSITVICKPVTLAEVAESFPEIPAGNYLQIEIRDGGIGMSRETTERIFDPFFTTKPIGEGTGLGLSIVHGLVRDMNGHLAVRSKVGEGSAFSIFLPLIKKQEN